ncbi:related to STE6-`Full-size` ABC transporter responsible for export of the `a` factor mating pheromon [Claviceps purpurea 20.1]|uniref:Related to STE6-`Full-size` ABC transporter responsible for export of the `a` factor mating pheromon n=2 Tax=Claviceps TaxID=5110 RepID=M1VVR2_CLAP2|nr:related to STE6-`Full-size` ABC transporter responsible for export of the `a` factor mating pheromon [Claviceps purpurea 20.1]
MAYVPQQPFLFPATIRDNIAYGISTACPMSVQEAVTQAAKASGIHDFIISLPDGYDTVVGDGGQALSGGQAQLVNIARALARRPRLIILDEPSSALDPESAAHVRETLALFTRSSSWQQDGMAVVVATHSIEMMRIATKVLVLNEGFTVEQGTYGDLMARRRHLWRLVNQPKENIFAPNNT